MLGRLRTADRTTLFGLPFPRVARREVIRPPFLDCVWTVSEVAPLEATSAQARSLVSAEEARDVPTSDSAVVDVDALDEHDADRPDALPSPIIRTRLSGAHEESDALLPPLVSVPSARLQLHDAVVLSYRDEESEPCVRTLADRDCAATVADELLSVAVDDSRIFLRRGGRVQVGRGDSRSLSTRLHVSTRTDEDEQVREGDYTSQKTPLLPIFTTRWRQETSLHLPHAQSQLFRVRARGGAQSALLFSGGGDGGGGRRCDGAASCQADFVALARSSMSLVHAREYGTDLSALQHVPFNGEMLLNATCMDDWGPHCTVVGFSNGTLRVVDWRIAPSSSSVSPQLVTQVPQPRWLGTRRRTSLVVTTVAGLLACCALEDSYRVVCGLGDAAGTVAIADLRKPEATAQPKRSRRSETARQREALFADFSTQTVTGCAVTDISCDPGCFGRLGLVDMDGNSAVTHISVLEGTRSADDVGISSAPAAASAVARAPVAGDGSPHSPVPTRRRSRLPSPPLPWQLQSRADRLSSAAPPQRDSFTTTQQGASTLEAVRREGPAMLDARSHRPRCVFTSDSRFLAHTDALGVLGGTSAVLRPVASTSAGWMCGRQTTATAPTRVEVQSVSPDTAAAQFSPFIAVSSVDRLVCFDTSDGNTLSMMLR